MVSGIVTSVLPFMAIIKLGEGSGLLHITQIGHDGLSDLTSLTGILLEGQELKVGRT